MTARHATRTAFSRYAQRQADAARWDPVDLGGHEVVARLNMSLRPGVEAVGEGRHALDPLEGAIDGEELNTLRLLVTELVTNSVRHSGAPSWIGLNVDIYSNAVRVAVSDSGAGFEPPAEPMPHLDRPGGWGLYLVDCLSDRWGVARGDRTLVWFELDRALAAA